MNRRKTDYLNEKGIIIMAIDDYSEEISDTKDKVKVCSIPGAILHVFQRVFR